MVHSINDLNEATTKLLQLYGQQTKDLQITRIQDGHGALAIVLGIPFTRMIVVHDVVQFYTEDCLLRIDFPLIDMKGCHTFSLDRFVGHSDPIIGSSNENWEFEDFVLVKEVKEG